MSHYVYKGNPCCAPSSCGSGGAITINGGSMTGSDGIITINGDGYGGGTVNILATIIDIVGGLQLTNYPSAGFLYTNSDGYIEIGDGTPITYLTPLGQDLDGYLPNPFVVGLYGSPIANTPPVNGYALVWNGTNYAPAPASGGGGDFISFLLMGC